MTSAAVCLLVCAGYGCLRASALDGQGHRCEWASDASRLPGGRVACQEYHVAEAESVCCCNHDRGLDHLLCVAPGSMLLLLRRRRAPWRDRSGRSQPKTKKIGQGMADGGESADAKRKRTAEERRQKILSRGTDRLNKITTTARGEEEAKKLYRSHQPLHASALPRQTASANDDPADIDLSATDAAARQRLQGQQAQRMRDMFGGPSGGPRPPSAALMAESDDELSGPEAARWDPASTAFGPRSMASPLNAPNPDKPFDMASLLANMGGGDGSANAETMPPFLAQMLQGMGAQSNDVPLQVVSPKTWPERLFPVVHIASMVLLAGYAILIIEPGNRWTSFGGSISGGLRVQWEGWRSLATRSPAKTPDGLAAQVWSGGSWIAAVVGSLAIIARSS